MLRSGKVYRVRYCCSFIVSTMDSLPIFLIGRRMASAAEPKQKMTISASDGAGSRQPIPHLSAIRNRNIILINYPGASTQVL